VAKAHHLAGKAHHLVAGKAHHLAGKAHHLAGKAHHLAGKAHHFDLNVFLTINSFIDPGQPSVVEQGKKGNHQGHKMEKCCKCGKESEARRLTQGLCAMCSKGKAKTVANLPTSNFLNASALN
jgi:hypothetical protein